MSTKPKQATTVGELRKFLAKFDDNYAVVVEGKNAEVTDVGMIFLMDDEDSGEKIVVISI